MKVRAAVAYESRPSFSIEEIEMSDPGPENILVRMVGCGLCHTDVKAREGTMGVPMPAVLGHEGAGIVERVGERVTKVKPGDHVVLTGDSCGACPTCQAGNPAYCDEMSPLNFADGRAGQPGSFRSGTTAIHGHFFGQSSFCNYAVTREHNTIPGAQRCAARNSRSAGLRRADGRGRRHEFARSRRRAARSPSSAWVPWDSAL